MSEVDSTSSVTPAQLHRARRLGVVRFVDSRWYRKHVGRPLTAVLDAATASQNWRTVGTDERLTILGECAARHLERNPGVVNRIKARKVEALDDAEHWNEWFELAGLLVAARYLGRAAVSHRSQTATAADVDGEALIREARATRRAAASLRGLTQQFLACATTGCAACQYERPWCVRLSERAISAADYVVPNTTLFTDGVADNTVSLDGAFETWLGKDSPRHMLLLGEYGIGKTAACIHLLDRLAGSGTKPIGNSRMAIYLPLESYARSRPTTGRLSDLLLHALGSDLDVTELSTASLSDWVFILDGLDEMGASATIANIRANLDFLRPFLKSGARVLLTCRTHLFATTTELGDAIRDSDHAGELLTRVRSSHDYVIAELQELTDADVLEISERVRPDENGARIWAELSDYYDLPDLARRPILLGLILGSLDVLRERGVEGAPMNETSLYDAYVQTWAEREMSHKGGPVSLEEKLALAETIALTMYGQGVLSATKSGVQEAIRMLSPTAPLTRAELDAFDYDARDTSFLTCDLAGNYRFMHSSFQEYFAARAFLSDLDSGEMRAWGSRWLGRNVARFLAQMAEAAETGRPIRRIIDLAATETSPTILWNALHLLSLLDPSALSSEDRALISTRLIPRGMTVPSAVIVRQYARIADRYGARRDAEKLIERVLTIVSKDAEQQRENNETYINYYGGRDAASVAFLEHLKSPTHKYDRRLHLHVLSQLGGARHAASLGDIIAMWPPDEQEEGLATLATIRNEGA